MLARGPEAEVVERRRRSRAVRVRPVAHAHRAASFRGRRHRRDRPLASRAARLVGERAPPAPGRRQRDRGRARARRVVPGGRPPAPPRTRSRGSRTAATSTSSPSLLTGGRRSGDARGGPDDRHRQVQGPQRHVRPSGRRPGPALRRRARSPSAVRDQDVPARIGGEEFAVLLRNPGPMDAVEVGERVRQAVATLDLGRLGIPGVSVSVGVANATSPEEPIAALVDRADQALLRAKRAGRDRVIAGVGGSPPIPSPGWTGQPTPTSSTRSHPSTTRKRRPRLPGWAARSGAADGEVPLLTNGQLAQVFHDIGDLLEVKGELVFKTVAYHRAADAIGRSPIEVARAYREGRPPEIPGVGKAIADKLEELATTGRSEYRDKLLAEFPTSLLEMLRLPGLGPEDRPADLHGARRQDARRAQGGRRGQADPRHPRPHRADRAERSSRASSASNAREGRLLLPQAKVLIDEISAGLLRRPRRRADRARGLVPPPEGDDRRPRPPRRDGLARSRSSRRSSTCRRSRRSSGGARTRPRFGSAGAARRSTSCSCARTRRGTYLIHFTGSKEHNVRLRAMARDKGWSLSEYGFAKIGEDGEIAHRPRRASCGPSPTEAEAYAFLGLPFIEPELREDARRDRGGARRHACRPS